MSWQQHQQQQQWHHGAVSSLGAPAMMLGNSSSSSLCYSSCCCYGCCCCLRAAGRLSYVNAPVGAGGASAVASVHRTSSTNNCSRLLGGVLLVAAKWALWRSIGRGCGTTSSSSSTAQGLRSAFCCLHVYAFGEVGSEGGQRPCAVAVRSGLGLVSSRRMLQQQQQQQQQRQPVKTREVLIVGWLAVQAATATAAAAAAAAGVGLKFVLSQGRGPPVVDCKYEAAAALHRCR